MTESRSRTAHIVPNQYRDSVSLMQLSSTLMGLEGIDQASVVVASSGNLDLLRGFARRRREWRQGNLTPSRNEPLRLD